MVNALKKAKSRKEGFREGEFNTLVRDDLAGAGGASKGGLGEGLRGGGWRTSKASMWLWCWLELSEMGQGGNGHRGEALWVLAFRS